METQLLLVLILTFLINLIATLSYSVRIVGIQTRRVAISFALFNILVLVSRTANGFQAPLLAKVVENDLRDGVSEREMLFRMIICTSTIATIIGAIMIPTFQRLLSKAVYYFSIHKSILKILFNSFSNQGIRLVKRSIVLPRKKNITQLSVTDDIPWRIFLFNILAVAILTVGVLSSVYAAYLNPTYRSTASNLSAFVNGFATILMFAFIDPYLSALTDDVSQGKFKESTFRKHIIYMTIARLIGTVLAQILFLPSASFLAWMASRI